ncbi:MAG: hypothetical protein PHY05_14095, partial [Methanothrix sp.]|nr:hypothetical protein [Methanothrix sp.]
MTNGKDVKPSSITKRAVRYLIACIAILIWLGLLADYWPAALAIAVIGGIIWRSRKSSNKKLPEITPLLDPLAGNTSRAAQLSSSMPTIAESIPGPVITV